jgi:hypothetical protein
MNKLLLGITAGLLTLRKGLDTVESLSVEASGFTKTRAFPTKSGQNISSSVGFTKTRAFAENLVRIFLVL